MINLLPHHEKKHLEREQLYRFFIVLFITLFFGVLVGSILLTPSFLISSVKINEAKQQLQTVVDAELQSEQESYTSTFIAANEKADTLLALQDRPMMSALLEGLLEHRPDGVVLSGIIYQYNEGTTAGDQGGTFSFVIIGTAATRDGLISFSQSLENSEQFSRVVLPVSNLAHDRDISFSITIEGN